MSFGRIPNEHWQDVKWHWLSAAKLAAQAAPHATLEVAALLAQAGLGEVCGFIEAPRAGRGLLTHEYRHEIHCSVPSSPSLESFLITRSRFHLVFPYP